MFFGPKKTWFTTIHSYPSKAGPFVPAPYEEIQKEQQAGPNEECWLKQQT